MKVSKQIFSGCIPALMTPCSKHGEPLYEALIDKGKELVALGMTGVVYCGSMGEWPQLTDGQRQKGVEKLVSAGIPVIVGTGAQNTRIAVQHAAHAHDVGAAGLMVIPRVLSRGASSAAQQAHFESILKAGGNLPAVIYNSPYYGFETKAELFFQLHDCFPNLVGFKEFGGAAALSYAAEHITAGNPELALLVGVDTQVFHGFVNCNASGAITGIGNALPKEILRLVELCRQAATGDTQARLRALELNEALTVLSQFDAGPDLVLYYKALMVLEGSPEYENQLNPQDVLAGSQRRHLEKQWRQFRQWWEKWPGASEETKN